MLSAIQKERYWRIVEACLVEIMGMELGEAYRKVMALRVKVAKRYHGEKNELFYHDEPINIAVALAGFEAGEFNHQVHDEQYEAIQNRYTTEEIPKYRVQFALGSIELEVEGSLEITQKLEQLLSSPIIEES